MSETGDPELAAFMRRMGVKAPVERIVETDILATAFNMDRLKLPERIVRLACGHEIVTKNWRRAPCWKCHEMILNGEDYEAFRSGREWE